MLCLFIYFLFGLMFLFRKKVFNKNAKATKRPKRPFFPKYIYTLENNFLEIVLLKGSIRSLSRLSHFPYMVVLFYSTYINPFLFSHLGPSHLKHQANDYVKHRNYFYF